MLIKKSFLTHVVSDSISVGYCFRAGIRATVILLPILGITWIFGIFTLSEDTIIFSYIFCILNSIQVSLHFCLAHLSIMKITHKLRICLILCIFPVDVGDGIGIDHLRFACHPQWRSAYQSFHLHVHKLSWSAICITWCTCFSARAWVHCSSAFVL